MEISWSQPSSQGFYLILVFAGYQKDADAEVDHSIRGVAKNSPEAAPRFQPHAVGGRF